MTNADQPENITTRLDEIDTRLDELGDEIDLIRTIQSANRRELRTTSQTAARLERTVSQLADIARLHQISLREAERDRQALRDEIREIWRYLRYEPGNGRGREQ